MRQIGLVAADDYHSRLAQEIAMTQAIEKIFT